MRYLIAAFIIFAPTAVIAGSSSVSISALHVAGAEGSYASERMRVTNTDTLDQRYDIAFPALFADGASVNPARFALGPGESRDVVLRFKLPRQSGRTHLAVMSRDVRSASALTIANGIKIPVFYEVPRVAGLSIVSPDSPGQSSAWPGALRIAVYAIDAILIIAAGRLMRRRKMPNRGAGYQISFV